MVKPLTKKDVKDVVVEVFTPFSRAIQKDFSGGNRRFDKVDERLDEFDGRFGKLLKIWKKSRDMGYVFCEKDIHSLSNIECCII